MEQDVTGKVVKQTPTLEVELSIEENAPNMVKTNLLGAYNQNNILAARHFHNLKKQYHS